LNDEVTMIMGCAFRICSPVAVICCKASSATELMGDFGVI